MQLFVFAAVNTCLFFLSLTCLGFFLFNHIYSWLSLPTLQQPLHNFPRHQAHQAAFSSIFPTPFLLGPSSHLIYSGSLLARPKTSNCGRAGMGAWWGEGSPLSLQTLEAALSASHCAPALQVWLRHVLPCSLPCSLLPQHVLTRRPGSAPARVSASLTNRREWPASCGHCPACLLPHLPPRWAPG